MHKILAIISFLVISVGCSWLNPKEYIYLQQKEFSIDCNGGDIDIAITGSSSWTSESHADWIRVRKTQGGAVATISSNPGKARTDSIRFMTEDISETVIINQEVTDRFELTVTEIRAGQKGGKFSLGIDRNREWEIIGSPEWMTVSPSKGDSPTSVEIDIKPNMDHTDRNCSLTVYSQNEEKDITVYQKRTALIDVGTETVETDGDGGIRSVLFISNVDVRINTSDDWIRIIDTEPGLNKISFEVIRNMSEAREGTIMITEEADDLTDIPAKDSILVRQGAWIPHPRIYFSEGRTLTVTSPDKFRLTPVCEDMEDTLLIWSSDDRNIAEISQDGTVLPVRSGKCKINAISEVYGISASLTLDIRLKAEDMTIYLGEQDMTESPVAVRYVNENMRLRVEMNPAEAYAEDVIFYVEDSSIASVSGKTLTCISPGVTTVYAESIFQGLSKTFSLIVLSGN